MQGLTQGTEGRSECIVVDLLGASPLASQGLLQGTCPVAGRCTAAFAAFGWLWAQSLTCKQAVRVPDTHLFDVCSPLSKVVVDTYEYACIGLLSQ